MAGAGGGGSPIVVVGLDPIGIAVLHRLHALHVPVRALVTPVEAGRFGGELAALGIDTVRASTAWEADLVRMDLNACGGLVLAADDDSLNVDACLIVRRYSQDLPILVRVSDPTLVRFLRMSVPHVDVYSMGSTTAPVAAEMAMHLLGTPRDRPPVTRSRPRGRLPRASSLLLAVLPVCAVALFVATMVFAKAFHLKPFDALYTAWMAMVSVGHGDPHFLRASPGVRATAMAMSLVGWTLLATTVGLVVDWLLTRRFHGVVSGTPVRMQNHVVVFGAGNVGSRVAELLHQRKVKVVVVESQGGIRNVQRLRSAGVPVVVGDAMVDETLDRAGAWWAGAALALTNSDAVNLHLGLHMTDKKVAVPAVVRLVSPELSAHVAHHPDLSPLSPVFETASHVCRTVERMRAERMKARQDVALTVDSVRTTGRFAGPEFDGPLAALADSGTFPAAVPNVPKGGADRNRAEVRHEPAA